jgi:hypothetical protein
MPDVTVWAKFAQSFPSPYTEANVTEFLDYLKDNGYNNFKDLMFADKKDIADKFVDFFADDGGSRKGFTVEQATSLIQTATSLDNCSSKEELDSAFFNNLRQEERGGAIELLETLKEGTPGAEISAADFIGMTANDLADIIQSLPCSHAFIESKSRVIIDDANSLAESIIEINTVPSQLKQVNGSGTFTGTYLRNYKLEIKDSTSGTPKVVGTSDTQQTGNASISIPLTPGITEYEDFATPVKLKIYDKEGEVVQFKVAGGGSFISEYSIATLPPSTGDITALKTIVIQEPNPVYPSETEITLGSGFYTVTGITFVGTYTSYLLNKHLADIRLAGGFIALVGEEHFNVGDIVAAAKMDAYASLDLVSSNVGFNKILIQGNEAITPGITSFSGILKYTRADFIKLATDSSVTGTNRVGHYGAAIIYQKAQSLTSYLNNYITERRKNYVTQ